MSLRIIGAGLPRTGTFSLKRALEQLGIGRCYHMNEVFAHPEHMPQWERAAQGTLPEWQSLFAGYAATADSPACFFWRELCDAYPAAKVILSLREPSEWYASMQTTVVELMVKPSLVPDPRAQAVLEGSRRLVLDRFFEGRFEDREHALARYRAHAEAVQATIGRERLLVYEVADGWAPLCAFLGVPVPNEPFPMTNMRDAFRARAGLPALKPER